jgi:ADP-heptose:LPS heptosyltransferase
MAGLTKIVVLRALAGLGDQLCAIPAFRALRSALPEAHITLVGLRVARPVIDRFRNYIDELLELPGYPGLPECTPDLRAIPEFLARIQARRFDMALQLHGSGTVTNPLTVLLGARINAGLFLPGEYCPDPQRFVSCPPEESEIRRCLRVLEAAGIPPAGEELEFPLVDADDRRLAEIEAAHGLRPGCYACIHPGSSTPARRWAPERFAAIGDWLAEQDVRVVLTGGDAERDVARAVASAMSSVPLDMTGRTDLPLLAAVFSHARLLVGNDTGTSHLAAAVGLPSVVIFASDATQRWAPLNADRHRVVSPQGPGGVAAVAVDDVLSAARQLLLRSV